MGIIYCYHNKISGKRYIGQTFHPDQRKRSHLSESKLGSDYYFHRALRKHGMENFEYEMLEELDDADVMTAREKYWINHYNTIWPNGYNQKIPDVAMTDEIRKKISESQKKRMARRTPEQILSENEKRSRKLKGHVQTEYQKSRVREVNQKTWKVYPPDDAEPIIVTNLRQYAIDNGLDQGNLTRTANSTWSKHKGYRVERLNT